MSDLISQPSNKPTRKVALAAVIGAPLAAAVTALLAMTGISIPDALAAPLGALAAAAVAYWVKERAPVKSVEPGRGRAGQ